MEIGKLNNNLLKRIVIDKINYRRPEVLSGPDIGEDCAVLDFGSFECVVSTDPITAAIEKIGTLAVHVSCNDIASNGVEPLGILLTVLLPPGTLASEIEEIMRQATDAAASLGVAIIGGHTEITDAVTKPVISATAIGRGTAGASRREEMRAGDHILVTKQLAMEGTGIIATEHADALKTVLTDAERAEAVAMLNEISVVKEGLIAGRIGVSGMHDITEGGVFGAVWELCALSGVGAQIDEAALPIAAVTRKLCTHYKLDPYRLISSGSMLIIARPDKSARIQTALAEAGIAVAQIGVIRDERAGIGMVPNPEFFVECESSERAGIGMLPTSRADDAINVAGVAGSSPQRGSRRPAGPERRGTLPPPHHEIPIDAPGSDEIYKVQ